MHATEPDPHSFEQQEILKKEIKNGTLSFKTNKTKDSLLDDPEIATQHYPLIHPLTASVAFI